MHGAMIKDKVIESNIRFLLSLLPPQYCKIVNSQTGLNIKHPELQTARITDSNFLFTSCNLYSVF